MIYLKNTMIKLDIKQYIKQNIYIHPKLEYQQLLTSSYIEDFIKNLPPLIPFNGYSYFSAMLIFDWDHKIPSNKLFGRIFCFYEEKSYQLAISEYKERLKIINKIKDYPEFDTLDFYSITADETYTFFMNIKGEIKKIDFDAIWKKDFLRSELKKISKIVFYSTEYKQLKEKTKSSCGPIRIISWVPPCKTLLSKWTVDVRYVSYCEKTSVWGKIFYVDPEDEVIMKTDNFNMRI